MPDKPEDQPGPNRDEQGPDSKSKKRRNPLVLIIGAIILAIALIVGIRYYLYARVHTGTDDAYVTSDIIQIAPQVSGTVIKVLVSENDHVKAGQVLAEVDPTTYRQAVAQAQANLDLALAQEAGAKTSTNLTQVQGSAQVQSAQGGVMQSSAGIGSAKEDVGRAAAAVETARASAQNAKAGIANALSALAGARSQISRNQAMVVGARASLQQAQQSVGSARSTLTSAQANNFKAGHDYARSQVLFSEGALSAQQNDAYRAASTAAAAQLSSAQVGVANAQAAVDQQRSNLAAAEAALQSSHAAADQAQAQLAGARSQYAASSDQITQDLQLELEAEKNVETAQGKQTQSVGQLNQAKTVRQQVEVSENSIVQNRARVEQARAALDQANVNLNDCIIRAPLAGQVTRKTVDVGTLVQNGTPLMALVPDGVMWVEANFKETQLDGVRIGEKAQIEVDAVPGHTYQGTVQSISRGTGSTFALLPPDNATGNFTKVVQRIPIKITFDSNQRDLMLLRAGMSVSATIDLTP